jgi:glycosyltransferase involved in cell wall biosynthesis
MDNIHVKKIKVAFISHSAGMAGAERSLLELIEGLRMNGVLPYVIIPQKGPLEEELRKRLIPYDILYYRWWTMNQGEEKEKIDDEINRQAVSLALLLEKVNPDIIYTNTSVINVGALTSKILGKPHIWHIREFGEPYYRFLLSIEDRAKFVHENSEQVIFNSKAVKDYYKDKKGIVVYNNISIDFQISTDDTKKYGIIFKNKKSYKLAIIGSVCSGKNQEDVILAVKDLIKIGIDTELVIVGDEELEYVKKMKQLVFDNKLEDNIRFLGYIAKPYYVLKETDVLVVCSKKEAFGRVIVEGMLSKKPVIATKVGGILEIITDGINGLLYNPGDHMELVEKLKFLFENKDKAEIYAKNGYDFAINNFNDNEYSGKVNQVFAATKNFVVSHLNSLLSKLWKLQIEDIEKRDANALDLIKTIESKDQNISSLKQELISKNNEINSIRTSIINIEAELNSIKVQLTSSLNELNRIYCCRGWRMIVFLRRILKIVVPDGSLRRRVAGLFFKISRKIYRFSFKIKNIIIYFKKKVKKSFIILKRDGISIFSKKVFKHFTNSRVQNSLLENKKTSNIKPIKSVYFISNVLTGGASKYICDLIDNFDTCYLRFVQIKNISDIDFYKMQFMKDDILLFQYFFNSDIKYEDILYIKEKYRLKLIIPVHDFYFLSKSVGDLYHFNIKVHENHTGKLLFQPQIINLLKLADLIIYPTKFVKKIYDSVFVFDNTCVSRHIDYKILNYLNIPKVEGDINIGVINDVHFPKGATCYPLLFNIKEYKGHRIVYHIFGHSKIDAHNVVFHGPYNEEEIFLLLQRHNIHGLAFLNEQPETYSYALTKGINSGLPILYSNIGAYTERLCDNKKFFPVDSLIDINVDFKKMLDFVLKNQGSYLSDKIIEIDKDIPNLYKDLFSIDYNTILNNKLSKNKDLYNKLFNFVEPYAIYLPQFHSIKENNKTFYDGYHDMINLQQVKKTDLSIETPLKNFFGYYNLKNDTGIIDKQILTAKAYGFKGFGIYYYWFSHNTISGNNMIMKDVIDKFFEKEVDGFDVFFIYANESWSGNPAFNQHSNKYIITNEYSKKEIIKNFENLLKYFKHPNYKKINNKPVLLVHHPWEMTSEGLNLFYNIGDEIMRNNGFLGLELVVNSMKGQYEEHKNYSHHADYKNDLSFSTIEGNTRYIDYQKYVDDFLPSNINRFKNIQTSFYNFNNSVRYHNHRTKNSLITKTKNNNQELFRRFLNLQLDTYNSPDKVGKIFLINSWNEWGEQMALEPSSEAGFELLNVFNQAILDFINKK